VATAPESLTGYDFLAAGGIHFGFSLTMPTAVVVKGDGVGGVTSIHIWQVHYNRARPHSRLGPGLPLASIIGHELPRDMRVVARPILGGLHHEYGFERRAA
jgi:hypothetical protein